MPSRVTTGVSLFAVTMTFTSCLRFARALPLNSGSGARQRYAYVGHRAVISGLGQSRRTSASQSLSCTSPAARGTESRGAGNPAERIYQLAGREFDIGKHSTLAKVGAILLCLCLPCDTKCHSLAVNSPCSRPMYDSSLSTRTRQFLDVMCAMCDVRMVRSRLCQTTIIEPV